MSPPAVLSSAGITQPHYPPEDALANEDGVTVVVIRPDPKRPDITDVPLQTSPFSHYSSILTEVTEGIVYGDFKEEPTLSSIAGQIFGGFVPFLGQALDLRDTGAALDKIWRGREGGFRDLALSLLGWVPGVGDVAKHTVSAGFESAGKIVAGTVAIGQSLSRKTGELFEQLTSRLTKDSLGASKIAQLPHTLERIISRKDLSNDLRAQAQESLAILAEGVQTGMVKLEDNTAQVFSLLETAASGSPAQASEALYHLGHAAEIVKEVRNSGGVIELSTLALEVGANARIGGLPPLAVEKLSADVYFQTIEHLPSGEKVVAHHVHEVTASVNSFANKMRDGRQVQRLATWLHEAKGADVRHLRIVVTDASRGFSRAFDQATTANIMKAMSLNDFERTMPIFQFENILFSYNDLMRLNEQVTNLVPKLMSEYGLKQKELVYSTFFDSLEQTAATFDRYRLFLGK